MGGKRASAAVALGVCAAFAAPAGPATAETAQDTITKLQSEGYTVTIDRIGTGPIEDCVVTGVRNPRTVTQWVPYVGPGGDAGNLLVRVVVSRSVSVSLDCGR